MGSPRMARHPDPDAPPEHREPCGHSLLGTATGAVLVLALLCAIAGAYQFGRDGPGVDFYQYWAVADAVSRGAGAEVYSPEVGALLGEEFWAEAQQSSSPRLRGTAAFRRVLEIYQTPFLHAVVSPFAGRDFEDCLAVFAAVSVACLVFALVVLCRLLGFSRLTTVAVVAVLAEWFGPVRSDLRVGNVNQILLALLALFLWLRSKPGGRAGAFFPGLVLGLAVMFKPTLAYVVLTLEISWVVNRRFGTFLSASGGILAGAAVAFAIGAAFHGSVSCWVAWLGAVRAMPGAIITLQMGNVGLSRLLSESLGVDVSWPLAVLFVLVSAAFLWGARRAAPAAGAAARGESGDEPGAPSEDFLALALGCLVCVLSAGLAWFHYFVLTIPAALILLRAADSSGSGGDRGAAMRRVLFVASVLCVAMEPWLGLVRIGAAPIVAVTDAGTLVLYGGLLWELRRRGRADCQAAGGAAMQSRWIERS